MRPIPAQTWLERLLGIGVVSAHNVPSEWWQVPLAGGAPVQLTHIQAAGLFAGLSPDKRFFACSTANNLFVMDANHAGLRVIVEDLGGIYSSVSWIP